MDTNFHEPKLSIETYEQSAIRQRDRLAFVEHICGAMIEDRFDLEEPPRAWRVFHGDVQSLFSTVMCDEVMPDVAFDFMPGEFVFMKFISRGSAAPWEANGRPLAGGVSWINKGEPPASAGGFFCDARSNSPPFGIFECLGRDSPNGLFAPLRLCGKQRVSPAKPPRPQRKAGKRFIHIDL